MEPGQNELVGMSSNELTAAYQRLSPETRRAWLQMQLRKEEHEITEAALSELRTENEVLRHRQDMVEAEIGGVRDGLRQAVDASARRTQAADRYYTRTTIGDTFSPAISAKRMTKLLRVVGILTNHGAPYHKYQSGAEPLAKLKPWTEYPTWLFHAEKTTSIINDWLTEHDYHQDFHNTATKEDRDTFIDMLYEEYST